MHKLFLVTTFTLSILLLPGLAGSNPPSPRQSPASFLFSTISKPLIATAPAQVVSGNEEDIGSLIDGEIKTLDISKGQHVKQHQLLIEFRCDAYSLTLRQQQISLRKAQLLEKIASTELQRNQALFKENTISATTYQKAIDALELAAIERAQSEVARLLAQYKHSNCQIRAPFDGQVTTVYSGKGGYVTAGTPLLHLLQTDNLEVMAELDKEQLEQIQPSKSLDFIADEIKAPVAIRAINEKQDARTGRQQVYLTLKNAERIVSGMRGRLQWISEQRQIAAKFLLRRQQALGILLKKGDKVEFKPIPGAIYGLPAKLELALDSEVILP